MRKMPLAAIALVMLASASCGSGTSSGPTTSSRPSSGLPATTTTHGPSALDDLTPFFTAAADVDVKLKAAAVAVNRVISGDKIVLDQSARDAIAAVDPNGAKNAIPAGLPPTLERAVLVVYNDLVSRRSAFNGVERNDDTESINCLRNGAAPAAQFADDVKSARTLAASTPPLTPVASDSRAAEELAVRFVWIDEVNNGCAGCGGMVIKDLPPTTIYAVPVTPQGYDRTFDGEIQGVYFTATYVVEHGWNIMLNAC
ncbi:MAG TPA: hypothetical protein VNG12_11530 [Acidimicrobiales bacterium]|nr:hypothetical protein [Acidimicrobiales bacterium]